MDFKRVGQIVAGSLPWVRARRAVRLRAEPERIVLHPRPGYRQSNKPPVRIFVGTEPAQYRAERVFIWSVEQVRDPARVYEIYLMKELAGFDQRLWLTGFTNYRFAVPHFAGAHGRAIYNDVDQVYLADPAQLFDASMGGCALLVVPPLTRPDTSVMLLDCARMAQVWSLRAAQRTLKSSLLAAAFGQPGRAGLMAPEWNARDEEYDRGRSKLLHFTIIHMQPWQPFPKRYVYQRNPVGHVWQALERAADAVGYQIFDFGRPSAGYRKLCQRWRTAVDEDIMAVDAVPALIDKTGARSILHYVPGEGRHGLPPVRLVHKEDPLITRVDPAMEVHSTRADTVFDGVLCGEGLDYLEDDDVPWVLEALFSMARQFVYLRVGFSPGRGGGLRSARREPAWWFSQLRRVGARHPGIHWDLVVTSRRVLGGGRAYRRDGGRRLDGPPTMWVLTDEKPGHTTQSFGLARALGVPFEVKELRFNLLVRLSNIPLGSLAPLGVRPIALKRSHKDILSPPWPDIVLATGWRPAPVVRWIGARSFGRTRTVQLGRKGGRAAWQFDAVISCAYFRLPAHPNRIESVAPLNQVSQEQLENAAQRFAGLFGNAPRPHVALLVGGSSRRYRIEPCMARRMGEEVQAWAEAAGATVFAVTSRRTGVAATRALEAGLGAGAHVHHWRPGERDNPYLGYLALADAIVVTGESESMMAEAAAAGKPMYIYPVPERVPGPWVRLETWVERQTLRRRTNRRGKTRPQQGLEYLCARLIARGIVQPRRDLTLLQRELIDKGIAHAFGAPLQIDVRVPLREAEQIAARVRELLALPTTNDASAGAKPESPDQAHGGANA